MIIYGVGLLALCTLVGVIAGDLLGVLLGVKVCWWRGYRHDFTHLYTVMDGKTWNDDS